MPTDDNFEDGKGTGTATSGDPPGTPTNPNPHRNLVQDALDTSSGKHALLMVPNFKAVGDTSPQMNSYLRLGNAHSLAGDSAAVELGEDLATMVRGFTDDLRDRGTGHESNAAPHETLSQPPATPDQGATWLDTIARREESRNLHSKGGWRDHSDGNRITTTRGDKIEVIRGNYKMLVLGRSDGFDNVAGVEIAGGQVDSDPNDLTFGNGIDGGGPTLDASRQIALNTTFQWFQTPDGSFGWKQTVKTGDASAGGQNGQMITETFIDLQQDTVTAREITTTTNVATQTDTTNAGSISETISASDTVSNSTSAHSIDNVTESGLINEFTAVGLHDYCELAGLSVGANIFHTSLEVDLGLIDMSIELAAMKMDLEVVATNITLLIGTCVDLHSGVHDDTHTGIHIDTHVGAHLEIHEGIHATTKEAEVHISTAESVAIRAASSVELITGGIRLSSGANITIAGVNSTT